MNTDATVLAAQPFLKGFGRPQLELMSNNAMTVEFPAGKIIFTEGEPAKRFYVLLKGEVSLESAPAKAGGRPKPIQKINPAVGYELMKRVAKVVITRLQATRRQLLAGKTKVVRAKSADPAGKL